MRKFVLARLALFPTIPSNLDVCGRLGFLSGELGPAVISRIGSKLEITMKTFLGVIRCLAAQLGLLSPIP